MSKITSDGLTRSGTGCFYSCTHMPTVGVKGLMMCGICVEQNVEMFANELSHQQHMNVVLK